MRLREPAQIPMRPVLAVFAAVRAGAESAVLGGVFPGFAREVRDCGIEGREYGGVEGCGVEAFGYRVDGPAEGGEGVDLAGGAEDVGEDYDVGFVGGGVGVGGGWELDPRCVVHGLLVVSLLLLLLRIVVYSSLRRVLGFGVGEEGYELGVGGEEEAGGEEGRR